MGGLETIWIEVTLGACFSILCIIGTSWNHTGLASGSEEVLTDCAEIL